jgi:hypothetical protein
MTTTRDHARRAYIAGAAFAHLSDATDPVAAAHEWVERNVQDEPVAEAQERNLVEAAWAVEARRFHDVTRLPGVADSWVRQFEGVKRPLYTRPQPTGAALTEEQRKDAKYHAVELEQCALFVDSVPLARSMTEAAEFLRTLAAIQPQQASGGENG